MKDCLDARDWSYVRIKRCKDHISNRDSTQTCTRQVRKPSPQNRELPCSNLKTDVLARQSASATDYESQLFSSVLSLTSHHTTFPKLPSIRPCPASINVHPVLYLHLACRDADQTVGGSVQPCLKYAASIPFRNFYT
jgi:hypothetical protein